MKTRTIILIILLLLVIVAGVIYVKREEIFPNYYSYNEPSFTEPTREQVEWLKNSFQEAGL